MSVGLVLAIGAIGGVGALARFAVDGTVSQRVAGTFPFGTLAVNLLGAFGLGVLVGMAAGSDTNKLLGTGLIGAFTTFSTWVYESERLGEDGNLRLGMLNFAVSLVLGVLAAWAGRHVGSSI